ncbi:MAG: hypothetical protein IT350_15135 [Deltaproteobacteria bacterium]|nr:hypothetical protein [Deltaproteobacteria bacterium]
MTNRIHIALCAALAFAGFGFFAACGDIDIDSDTVDAQGGPAGGPSGDGGTASGDETWTNFAEAFTQTYCVRCHGDPPSGGAPFALVTYDDMVAQAAGSASEVQSGGMPTSSPFPTADEIASFVAWVESGTPE